MGDRGKEAHQGQRVTKLSRVSPATLSAAVSSREVGCRMGGRVGMGSPTSLHSPRPRNRHAHTHPLSGGTLRRNLVAVSSHLEEGSRVRGQETRR